VFRVWGLGVGYGFWGLGFGVWEVEVNEELMRCCTCVDGLGFGVWGLGFGHARTHARTHTHRTPAFPPPPQTPS
jgi:hypothetical protein